MATAAAIAQPNEPNRNGDLFPADFLEPQEPQPNEQTGLFSQYSAINATRTGSITWPVASNQQSIPIYVDSTGGARVFVGNGTITSATTGSVVVQYLPPTQQPTITDTIITRQGSLDTGIYSVCGNMVLADNTIITDTNGTYYITYKGSSDAIAICKEQLIRGRIKENLKPIVLHKYRSYTKSISPQEAIARNTLRDFLSEKEFRKYLKIGHVVVTGPSGRQYLLSTSQHVQVFENRQAIARICIHTTKDCPPTDHILNLMFLVMYDEEQVWKGGNVYKTNTEMLIGYGAGSNVTICGGDSGKNMNLLEFKKHINRMYVPLSA